MKQTKKSATKGAAKKASLRRPKSIQAFEELSAAEQQKVATHFVGAPKLPKTFYISVYHGGEVADAAPSKRGLYDTGDYLLKVTGFEVMKSPSKGEMVEIFANSLPYDCDYVSPEALA